MILITDTREQDELIFVQTHGVSVVRRTLEVGDYGAIHVVEGRELQDSTVIERKSVADLFSSYTNDYDREKAKIKRAMELRLKFVLAIEASASEIRWGHTYWDGTEQKEAKKSGISMIRQLMSVSRQYGVDVWFCESRYDMAFRIQEYFLAWERLTKDAKEIKA